MKKLIWATAVVAGAAAGAAWWWRRSTPSTDVWQEVEPVPVGSTWPSVDAVTTPEVVSDVAQEAEAVEAPKKPRKRAPKKAAVEEAAAPAQAAS